MGFKNNIDFTKYKSYPCKNLQVLEGFKTYAEYFNSNYPDRNNWFHPYNLKYSGENIIVRSDDTNIPGTLTRNGASNNTDALGVLEPCGSSIFWDYAAEEYTGFQISAVPFLIYYHETSFNEYVDSFGDGSFYSCLFLAQGSSVYEEFTPATIKNKFSDCVIIDSQIGYSNQFDGEISSDNKRPTVPGSPGIMYKMLFDGYAMIIPNWQFGDGILFTNISKSIVNMGDYNTGASTALYDSIIKNNGGEGAFFFTTKKNLSRGTAVSGQPAAKMFVVWKKDKLIKYLNSLGIPFTFDQQQAEENNSGDITDGYSPVGQPEDETGGGNGTGDNSSDNIVGSNPGITTIGAYNKHYAMSQMSLNNFSNYLWTSTFVDDIKLLFQNPSEGVISCRMFPFSLSSHDNSHVGAPELIKIGNVTTNNTASPINSGYNCLFNLGEISVEEYYGTAMDYEPYTSIQLYLPYIGIKDISTNEVMGKTLRIQYSVDITTGACIAMVYAVSKTTQLLASYDGKIGVEIPINSTNAAQFASTLALTALSGATGVAIGAATGNPLSIVGATLSTAKGVASNQIRINKGGANSPMASMYMPQYCYLIITRPQQSLASNFGEVHGYPANVTRRLGDLTGFTSCENPILDGIVCTDEERKMIKQQLEQGVIIR